MSEYQSHYNIDRIKDIPILDVAAELGMKVSRSGSLYKTLCPWHSERHPSLKLYPSNQSCACFSCRNGGSTIDLWMAVQGVDMKTAIQQLGDKFLKGDPTATERKKVKERPQPQTLHIRRDKMVQTTNREAYNKNILLSYLSTIYNPSRVVRTASEYLIGTLRNGSTIFWYMAYDGTVRSGKIMRYQQNGHRDKRKYLPDGNGGWKFSPPVDWMHSFLSREGLLNEWSREDIDPDKFKIDWQPQTTLFGEHLLHDPARRHLPVCIVESEKSAIIGDLHNPDYLWLATGGLSFLREERIAAVQMQGREIILIPDRDAINDKEVTTTAKDGTTTTRIIESWGTIANRFAYRDHIHLCTDVEDLAKDYEITDPKCDIADLYIFEATKGKKQ